MVRPKPDFIGLEACISDNDIPTTHHRCDVVADIRWSSPDYYSMLIMQSIFGNWDCALGSASASPLSSHLLDVITKYNLANLDDLMHFTLREWTRMSIVPTAAEAECAKS
jgi:processing peptidase subunit beta